MRRRLAGALLATLALVATCATPASASSGLCWVGGVQTARLSVTKYANPNVAARPTRPYEYHLDMNAGGNYRPYKLYFDGAELNNWNDTYVSPKSTASSHAIKGRWLYPVMEEQASAYCTVTL